jgi:hypothetical protein
MTMNECYVDTIDWLSKHERNGIFIRVKSEKELKVYQKYFRERVLEDLFSDEKMLDRIEWRIDSSLTK